MHDPVQDGICHGFLPDHIVPLGYWQLSGNDGGVFSVPILDDLHHGGPVMVVQGLHCKVVKDQQVGFFYPCDFLDVRAIGPRHFQHGKEFGGAGIKDLVAEHAGLVAQGRGDVAFPDPCAAGDQDVLALIDVRTFGKTVHQVLVQVTIDHKVDLFDIGLVAEAGRAYATGNAPVVAVIPFGLHQKGDHLIAGKLQVLAAFQAGLKSCGHAKQLHLFHLLKGVFVHELRMPWQDLYACSGCFRKESTAIMYLSVFSPTALARSMNFSGVQSLWYLCLVAR